jgi:serine/threonine-protein kinase
MSLRVDRWLVAALVVAVVAGLVVTWLLYPTPLMPRTAEVPALRGLPTAQAVSQLAASGLRGRIAEEIEDPLAEVGTVSWQSPVAETRLPQGAVVRLGISAGPPRVLVPDLAELDLGTAATLLEAAGLGIGRIDSAWSTSPAGSVVSTDPEARGPLRAGASVDVTVSKGPRRARR